MKVNAKLTIVHGKVVYEPVVLSGVTWQTSRAGAAGSLEFKVLHDNVLKITEGDAVRFKVNNKKVFFGFIFRISANSDGTLSVLAYDQLRYLKNKDSFVYSGKKANEVIKMIADDFGLKCGKLANTGYVIPSRVEDNTTLFDVIQNALDLTLTNTGKLFVLYDDYAQLTLKALKDMKTEVALTDATFQKYEYTTSIDGETYNQIKLVYDNEDTGKREVYMTKDSSHINKWGLLQYYGTLQGGENGAAKAETLLNLYNAKDTTLNVTNVIGDLSVRAGSLVGAFFKLPDKELKNYMLVEKCKHEFKAGEHWMTLELRGGDINA